MSRGIFLSLIVLLAVASNVDMRPQRGQNNGGGGYKPDIRRRTS